MHPRSTHSASPFPAQARSGRPRTEAIRRRLDRAYLVVHPPPELDEVTVPSFGERCFAIDDNTDIVIDLRDLQFCGSAGISLLLRIERHAAAHDCTLTLSSPPPAFDHLLRLCGLEDHFHIRRPGRRRATRQGGADPSRR